MKYIKYLCLSIFLTSCASYSTKFACRPANGKFCTPMHKIDELISSGEIEKIDLNIKKQARCKIIN